MRKLKQIMSYLSFMGIVLLIPTISAENKPLSEVRPTRSQNKVVNKEKELGIRNLLEEESDSFYKDFHGGMIETSDINELIKDFIGTDKTIQLNKIGNKRFLLAQFLVKQTIYRNHVPVHVITEYTSPLSGNNEDTVTWHTDKVNQMEEQELITRLHLPNTIILQNGKVFTGEHINYEVQLEGRSNSQPHRLLKPVSLVIPKSNTAGLELLEPILRDLLNSAQVIRNINSNSREYTVSAKVYYGLDELLTIEVLQRSSGSLKHYVISYTESH